MRCRLAIRCTGRVRCAAHLAPRRGTPRSSGFVDAPSRMPASRSNLHRQFLETGFAVVEGVLEKADLEPLRDEVDLLLSAKRTAGGVRNVLGKSRLLRELAESECAEVLARTILGSAPQPTKLTIFDKSVVANWKVPWHQDLTISVAERREVVGFGPWSTKDGVANVQPPASVLSQVVAIRLHLDETSPSNGALRVLSGTHKFGRLSPSQIAAFREQVPETVCPVGSGGCMLMSPLLLHASSQASSPRRRRVLHFEYSAIELPGGLAWA